MDGVAALRAVENARRRRSRRTTGRCCQRNWDRPCRANPKSDDYDEIKTESMMKLSLPVGFAPNEVTNCIEVPPLPLNPEIMRFVVKSNPTIDCRAPPPRVIGRLMVIVPEHVPSAACTSTFSITILPMAM